MRRRTLLGGKIEFFGRSTFDCVIRNRSDCGARVRCDQQIALPEVFNLVIEKSGERFVVRTIWRSETDVGVVFSSNVLAFPSRSA
ncbi:PilZ domain-containing protein [Methylocystis sp. JAN1]|uniref:PilZ domain-containing protein n=1 Tax=Methylocystis sp. JAN1 TaxID=3397211 RepID=UPI003FA1F82A